MANVLSSKSSGSHAPTPVFMPTFQKVRPAAGSDLVHSYSLPTSPSAWATGVQGAGWDLHMEQLVLQWTSCRMTPLLASPVLKWLLGGTSSSLNSVSARSQPPQVRSRPLSARQCSAQNKAACNNNKKAHSLKIKMTEKHSCPLPLKPQAF